MLAMPSPHTRTHTHMHTYTQLQPKHNAICILDGCFRTYLVKGKVGGYNSYSVKEHWKRWHSGAGEVGQYRVQQAEAKNSTIMKSGPSGNPLKRRSSGLFPLVVGTTRAEVPSAEAQLAAQAKVFMYHGGEAQGRLELIDASRGSSLYELQIIKKYSAHYSRTEKNGKKKMMIKKV